jgi:hypothetical protein
VQPDAPIMFSAQMVRALLEGTKTQTRRVAKSVPRAPGIHNVVHPQPKHPVPYLDAYCSERKTPENPRGMSREWCWWTRDDRAGAPFRVPYQPGMRLWVRETFSYDSGGAPLYWYWADTNEPDFGDWTKPKPAIHMPRRASRLTLTVTDVRIQRLQDISRGDAMAEGCPFSNMAAGPDPRDWFRGLWNSLHGPAAWEENPWVVAVSFRLQRGNIDTLTAGREAA